MLHSWPVNFCLVFISILQRFKALSAACSSTLIYTWFMHSVYFLFVNLYLFSFHFIACSFACNYHSVVFTFLASCDLFTHHLSFLFYDSASQWLLLLSGRMSPCAQSAEVLHWASHLSCCFWCWVQGQCPHTASCSFMSDLLTTMIVTFLGPSRCAWQGQIRHDNGMPILTVVFIHCNVTLIFIPSVIFAK